VIGDKYKGKLPTGWERMTSQQLKRLSDKGELVKVKASYKLGEVRNTGCLSDVSNCGPSKTRAAWLCTLGLSGTSAWHTDAPLETCYLAICCC
jgi:hypothetical protein